MSMSLTSAGELQVLVAAAAFWHGCRSEMNLVVCCAFSSFWPPVFSALIEDYALVLIVKMNDAFQALDALVVIDCCRVAV